MDGAPPTTGSAALQPPPDTIIEESSHSTPPFDTPVVDGPPPKKKTRHRLLRGLSSSSLAVSKANRARSSSTPYSRSGTSLSCVSLPASASSSSSSSSNAAIAAGLNIPLPPGTAGSLNNGSSSSSQSLTSPTTPFPAFPHSVSSNAIRKIDLTNRPATASRGTSPMPIDLVRVASTPLFPPRPRRTFTQLWNALPREVQIKILGFFKPVELVRLSGTSRSFHKICFDGQLWTSFDASEFYTQIPVESLAKIIISAGPFVKNLNLRGCKQMEKMEDAMLMASACNNVVNATLEGSCMSVENINALIQRNQRLAHINLAGLSTVHNSSCLTIATFCGELEKLNLSWCKNVRADAACMVLHACHKLRDLRLGEMNGFGDLRVAQGFFAANQLERLVLSGCTDLSDHSLAVMMHGLNPERDMLSGKPLTPPRALRYLDLSRCPQITDRGLQAVGQCAPHLEGLVLSGMKQVTDDGLKPLLANAQRLSVLEADDLPELTDDLLINHLATAPCAASHLRHLSLGYCENISDAGVLPVLRACKNLTTIQLDNTSITNETLIEAASIVRSREPATDTDTDTGISSSLCRRPHVGLTMEVYDCPHITWAGVREVMSRNAEALVPHRAHSAQIIALKCFYSWQMTANEHVKRVLQGRLDAARRLEQKWADFMQASEEAGTDGAGLRRRRRRMRAAEQAHADEHEEEADEANADGGAGDGQGRRRARTTTCAVM